MWPNKAFPIPVEAPRMIRDAFVGRTILTPAQLAISKLPKANARSLFEANSTHEYHCDLSFMGFPERLYLYVELFH